MAVLNRRKIEKKIRKLQKDFLKSKEDMEPLARRIETNIKADARNGKDWQDNEFPSIDEDTTVPRRIALSRVNKTSRFYAPSKSNATFTGDFIKVENVMSKKKIFARVIDSATVEVEF